MSAFGAIQLARMVSVLFAARLGSRPYVGFLIAPAAKARLCTALVRASFWEAVVLRECTVSATSFPSAARSATHQFLHRFQRSGAKGNGQYRAGASPR
eukprot:5965305-Lingulodinium_polyedra.AAC.1